MSPILVGGFLALALGIALALAARERPRADEPTPDEWLAANTARWYPPEERR